MKREKVKVLVEDLHEVLDAFAEKHGLDSATFKGVTFDDKGFKTTLRVNEKLDEDTKIADFEMKADIMGLPSGLYKKEITVDGTKFVVEDINTRAKKYPIVASDPKGARYKLAASAVK